MPPSRGSGGEGGSNRNQNFKCIVALTQKVHLEKFILQKYSDKFKYVYVQGCHNTKLNKKEKNYLGTSIDTHMTCLNNGVS